MAEITLERLNKINIEDYPSNSLVDYYDIIHKLLEAISLVEGIKIKGEGAHQELIDYTSKSLNFSEQKRQFLQQLIEYRNRVSYEGFMIRKEFISANKEDIKSIISLLFKEVKFK